MRSTRSKESFRIAFKNITGESRYAIQHKAQRLILWKENKKIIEYNKGPKINDLEKNRDVIKPMFKIVRSCATRYIKKQDFRPPMVERHYSPVFKNRKLWESLPNDAVFYHLDAKHCYWRIAYVLGYIAKGTYLKYCDDPGLKLVRNISLAVFNSDNKKEYFDEKGEKFNEITCDTSLYKVLYNNIRHYAYNNSGQIREAINDYCLAYIVDGIFILEQGLKKAKEIFKKNQLPYKMEKCIKIDEKNYSNPDGEIKSLFNIVNKPQPK